MADKARSNYNNYLAGKEPLRHTVLHQGDGETPIHDLMMKNISRKLWVIPFGQFRKAQKNKSKKK